MVMAVLYGAETDGPALPMYIFVPSSPYICRGFWYDEGDFFFEVYDESSHYR